MCPRFAKFNEDYRLNHVLSNRLLDALPPSERNTLLDQMQPVALRAREQLFGVGETPKFVHFPTSGLMSLVTTLAGGDSVEICIAGRDGFAEALHLLGPQTGEMHSFVQIEGTGLRMEFARFQDEFHRLPGLHDVVLRFVQYESLVMAQLAACNRLHDVEARLARWLLMVSDRVDTPVLNLTQEILADMIGARRSTVTLAAGALQRGGGIEYQRGQVRIVDRKALERAACDCFGVTKRLLDGLYR